MLKNNDHCSDKNKHLCLYIGSLTKGGAERVMCNLAVYFHEAGWKVTLVTTYMDDEEYTVDHAAWKRVPAGADGAEYVLNPSEKPVFVDLHGGEPGGIDRVFSALLPEEQKGRIQNIALRSQKLEKIFRELHPDVIVSFIGKNNIMALLTNLRTKIPVVVSVRSDPAREYKSKGLFMSAMTLFPKAAGVVLQTTRAKEFFPANIQKKVIILPNSVNPAFMRPAYIGGRDKEVVSVGRLDDNKNQGLLIKAFALATDGIHEDYKLVLYGDGPSRAKFQRLAAEVGLRDRCIFAGQVGHVAEHIEKTSLFVLPSKQEGMPNALIEAMSLGLPAISTDCPCGGPADIIEDGVNGILVPIEDGEVAVDENGMIVTGASADEMDVSNQHGRSNSNADYQKITDSHKASDHETADRKTVAYEKTVVTMACAIRKIIENPEFAASLGREASKIQHKYSPQQVNKMWEDYLTGIIERKR